MPCEMCGKTAERLIQIKLEGSILQVCSNCSKYGNQFQRPRFKRRKSIKIDENENIVIVDNFSKIIETARQNKGIKQEDFAKQIKEKESLIHNIETGHIKPSISLAKKIGKALGVNLLDEIKEEKLNFDSDFNRENKRKANSQSGALTIGDILKNKLKK